MTGTGRGDSADDHSGVDHSADDHSGESRDGAPFEPRVALASLSGASDAGWARRGSANASAAFLGGLSLDRPTRDAARAMVARDRDEFLPADPLGFVRGHLDALSGVDVRAGVNVRAVDPAAVRDLAVVCAERGAVCEVNAHCRQDEMCEAGAGEALLADPGRLAELVAASAEAGATTSAKLRTEVVADLPAVAERLDAAGADWLHVDAMDSEGVIAQVVAATDCAVIANNGVRDRRTVREYLACGADAVSVGRASDDAAVLYRVRRAVEEWFG